MKRFISCMLAVLLIAACMCAAAEYSWMETAAVYSGLYEHIYTVSSAMEDIWLTDCSASSELEESGYDHSAAMAFDGDANTAWVEGVGGYGIGETLTSTWNTYNEWYVVGVAVKNGYHKRESLFEKNGRCADVQVSVNGEVCSAVLLDSMQWQCIALPEPVYVRDAFDVSLTIMSVYAGTRYEDTCITEMEILAVPTLDGYMGFTQGFSPFSNEDGSYVTIECDFENGVEYAQANCWGADGLLWSYRVENSAITELEGVSAFFAGTYDDQLVMLYSRETGLTALDCLTGNVRWMLEPDQLGSMGSMSHAVDEETGIMYLAGYYGPDPIAVGMDGKVIWRTAVDEYNVYWLYDLQLETGGIRAYYDHLYGSMGSVKFGFDGSIISIDF